LVQKILGDAWTIEPEAMHAIEAYPWPGNVRQLLNAMERAQIMADGACIRLRDLPPEIVTPAQAGKASTRTAPASDDLAERQRAHVLQVLQREGGNKARAARVLGVNRRSLYRLLEKYGIEQPAPPPADGASRAAEAPMAK
jgi:DNA-binding NtrC family response regulator